jgi:cytochrome b6-f complex iron-sulfur subunit
MKRRDFMTFVGLGWIASCLPVALAACSLDSKTSSGSGKKWHVVGEAEGLKNAGMLLVKDSPVGPVLVVAGGAGQNPVAVNPTCPHAECTVTWTVESKKFSCPCHGSEFAIDGKVLKEPAKEALKTYDVKIEDNSVLVM